MIFEPVNEVQLQQVIRNFGRFKVSTSLLDAQHCESSCNALGTSYDWLILWIFRFFFSLLFLFFSLVSSD
jgi:hypothetical protein